MLTDLTSQLGAKLVIASIAVAFALLIFFLVARAWRNRGSGHFIRAGRGREPRLAVIDTTAVDQRRRLVLVRRDAVEHLILIGGPSDIVVESRIGAVDMAAKPAAVSQTLQERPEKTSPVSDDADREPTPEVEPRKATTAAAVPADVDVDEIFDNHRERVFGPAAGEQTLPHHVRAYVDDDFDLPKQTQGAGPAEPQTPGARASVVRFEDFLDSEVDSDLSNVRPNERSGPPAAPVVRDAPARPMQPAAGQSGTADDRVLSEEMSRLLSDLSHKR